MPLPGVGMPPVSPTELCLEILARYDAVVTGGHFVYTAGDHGDTYVNKDAPFPHTTDYNKLCNMLAEAVRRLRPEVIVAPATAGVALSFLIAHHLVMATGKEVLAVYADKVGDGYVLKRGFPELVHGRRVAVFDDISNSGKSLLGTIATVRACQGDVVAAGCFVNRGGITAQRLDVPTLFALAEIQLKRYPAADCPLCVADVPINTELGHGRAYMEMMAKLQ